METIIIAGGSGLVGKDLASHFASKGHKVIILSREKRIPTNGIAYAVWDTRTQTVDSQALEQATVVINLAGAGVADKRWSQERKQEILESRVQSGHTLTKALTSLPNKVHTFIQASAIGWYGADPVVPNPHPFSEEAPADTEFLGATCKAWEESIAALKSTSIRTITYRIGIVLSKNGGAFKEFYNPVRFRIVPTLGNGKQVVSWIHVKDLVGMIDYAIVSPTVQGVYNATAPAPVNNHTLMSVLGQIACGSLYIPVPVPSFVLKIMLGEMSIEVLKSATVSDKKILSAGYRFQFPTIDVAIKELLNKNEPGN